MSEGAATGPGSIRVSDAERNAAIEVLGAHLSAGRIDLDEYGTRSALINSARTVADLRAPFDDLPGPRPTLSTPPAPVRPTSPPAEYAGYPAAPTPGAVPAVPSTAGQRVAWAVAGSSGVIAVIAFFLLTPIWSYAWLVFLLVPVVYTVASAVTGVDVREARRRRR